MVLIHHRPEQQDHPARVVWAFVEQQDLSALYTQIRATEDRPGRTPIAPEILMALWLNATLDGERAARERAAPATLRRVPRGDVGRRRICEQG